MLRPDRAAAFALHALRFGALAVVLFAPLLAAPHWRFFIFQIVVAAYLAASFDLSYSYAKILSFGQGIFFAAGAYAAIYLATTAPWGLPLVLLTAAAAAIALGSLLGIVLVRMDNHNATIATVILAAVGLLAGNALTRLTGGEDGLAMHTDAVGMGPLQLAAGASLEMYYVAAIPLVLYFIVSWRFQNHRLWKVLRAVAQNETRAQQLGFNVRMRRLVVFVLAAGLAGVGGALYALLMKHVTTSVLDISLSVDAILWAVVGGLSAPFGPLLGVLVVYPTTEALASLFTYVQIVVGLVLIVVAVVFPRGIVGSLAEAARVQRERVGQAVNSKPPAEAGIDRTVYDVARQ